MLSRSCQVYDTTTPSLINEMPSHCLNKQSTETIDDIDHPSSQNWIKKLKSFYKSRRHLSKQNFNTTNDITSTTFNYKQEQSDDDSCFLIRSTTLVPLSAIDAEAIYHDASLSRTSSDLPTVQYSSYGSISKSNINHNNMTAATTATVEQLSAPNDTVIGKPETATVEQETTTVPTGDLSQGIRYQRPHHQQFQQTDKKEIQTLSLAMQYALYSQHLHHDSADKLSLSSSSSSSSTVSTSSGHTQCNRIKYEKDRDAASSRSHSSIHSLYSTFATSASNDIHTIPPMQPVPCASLSPEWPTLNYYHSSSLLESPTLPASPPDLHKENNEKNTPIPFPNTDNHHHHHLRLSPTTNTHCTETLAKKFWLGKQTICEHEKVASWLGTNEPFRAAVLKLYMDHFHFENQPLDEAFRILCGKLFFKAESQQMDRIIEAFAKRYWKCNPTKTYYNADVVYAISYSLLLLNTDLHGVHEHHQKMKRARFVRNTMDTITSLVFPTDPIESSSPSSSALLPLSSFSNGLRLRKSKSHHSLATSYRSTSKPSPLRNGSKPVLSLQQHLSSNNNTATSSNDSDDEISNNKKDTNGGGVNGLQNHRMPCKIPKTATKSQSLADLSFYLKRRNSVTDGLNQAMDQKRWVSNMELLLKDMYTSIKSREILRLSTTSMDNDMTPSSSLQDHRKPFYFYKLANEARNKHASRRKRGQSAPPASNSTSLNLENQAQGNGTEKDTPPPPSSPLQQQQEQRQIGNSLQQDDIMLPPISHYTPMEGWVMRKCLMQGTRQKAKQRNWIQCYLKIQDGKLIMQYHDRKVLCGQHWLNTIKHHGDDIIARNRVLLNKEDSFVLNHSLSRVLPPPGWHKQRTHVVCLQMTDGASWLFQVSTNQKAQDWMRALNYQAAFHSKEPLSGAVTNIDYGWNSNNTSTNNSSLPTWELPMSCMISTQLSKVDQLHAIHGYIGRLTCYVEHHRNLRGLVEKRFSPRTANRMKAMANWELKMQYLLLEKIKFQTYYDTLSCTLDGALV